MASLNPSSIYTPTGHDGWRFHISLNVASTSGNNVTINYSITTDRNGASSSYIEVSATSFSINGAEVASREPIGYGSMSDGMTVLSGRHTISGTSFSISFVGGYYSNTSHDCDISRTISVTGLNYTVTFNLAGGTRTGGGALTQSVPSGGSATPPTCSRPGYTFAGWNGSYTNVTSNRTITAKWTANTYTVTYNANGGSGAPASQTKTHGQDLILSSTKPTASWTLTYNANGGSVSPTSKSVSRPFRTWNTRADGTGTNYDAGATYTGNAPLTLYAQYSNAAAGTLPTPTRSNCTFNKWTTAQNSGSTVTSSTTIKKNTTIYAFWNYGVIRRGNGGFIQIYDPHEETVMVENEEGELVQETIAVDYRNVETATAYVAHGSSYTIPDEYVSINVDPDQPIGKTFQGWSTSSSGSVQYQNGQSLTITSVTNLYAIFETNSYTVNFVDGFNINSKSFRVQHGQTSPLPNGTTGGTTNVAVSNKWVQDNWAKPGYTFTGWLGSYTNVTGNRTITALWGFTPIWIRKNGKWVAYRAREE